MEHARHARYLQPGIPASFSASASDANPRYAVRRSGCCHRDPYSHILWAALWTGIAADACSKAAAFIRQQARQSPGKLPAATPELAALGAKLQPMRQNWESAASDFDALEDGTEARRALENIRRSLRLNNLEIFNSEAAPDIVRGALQVVGMAGYRFAHPSCGCAAGTQRRSGAHVPELHRRY